MSPASRYTKLKPSGAAWLGDVPSHWEVKPLWSIYRPKKDTGHPQETLLSVYRDYGVIEKRSRDDNRNRESEDLNGYQLVVNGDLVTNKMKTWQGSIAVSGIQGIVSPAYYVYRRLEPGNDAYFHLLFRSAPYIAGYQSISKGIRVGQWDLEADKFRLFPVLIPPRSEQDALVSQLGHASARIDGLITKKTCFIELLREKRRALITHAVTKGMDADVRMKDSGVEWLGEVPETWSIKRLRFVCDVTTGSRDTVNATLDGAYPFYVRSQEVARIDTYAADCEAVLTAGDGAGVGKVYHYAEGKFDFHQRVYMMYNFRYVRAKFFFYYLSSLFAAVALDGGAKSTVDSLRMPVFKNFQITIPRREEQDRIISFVENHASRIDTLIAKTERSIELLREHRIAIITAAVTGKIDLRKVI